MVLQAGQINTGAFDNFQQRVPMAHAQQAWVPMAHAQQAWVHVDGAFGLWARACPQHAALAAGVDLADS